MKKLFFVFFCSTLISCGKSIYYVYDTSNDIDHYNYCILEITSKKEIIYRAASYQYWAHSYPFSNLYVYIYSAKYNSDIDVDHYGFVAPMANVSYVKNGDNSKFEHLFMYFDEPLNSVFYSNENDTIVSTARKNFEYLKKGYGFKENGINWFPPYMVKTDKIDYSKFVEKVQHLNLKNPKKNKRKK